jgi:hypothetical protein
MVTGTGLRMDAAALARFSPRTADTGLLLGRDTRRVPVLLPLLRPEPTRLVLIGGLWLARLVVFRSLALGAQVLVCTVDPRRWDGLGAAAANAPGRVAVVPARPTVQAHAGEPVLHVVDGVAPAGAELGSGDRWQASLTVAEQLTGPAATALAYADAVLVQRMWPQQAAYVASLMRVDPAVGDAIGALPDDAAVLLSRGSQRQLSLVPTALEQRLFGPPQRV